MRCFKASPLRLDRSVISSSTASWTVSHRVGQNARRAGTRVVVVSAVSMETRPRWSRSGWEWVAVRPPWTEASTRTRSSSTTAVSLRSSTPEWKRLFKTQNNTTVAYTTLQHSCNECKMNTIKLFNTMQFNYTFAYCYIVEDLELWIKNSIIVFLCKKN